MPVPISTQELVGLNEMTRSLYNFFMHKTQPWIYSLVDWTYKEMILIIFVLKQWSKNDGLRQEARYSAPLSSECNYREMTSDRERSNYMPQDAKIDWHFGQGLTWPIPERGLPLTEVLYRASLRLLCEFFDNENREHLRQLQPTTVTTD